MAASKGTGTGEEDVYRPKLWYYTELEFLNDQVEGKYLPIPTSYIFLFYIGLTVRCKQNTYDDRLRAACTLLSS